MLQKIISTGQTGVARLGLVIAKAANIPTGGTASKDFRTETGPDLSLGPEYGLVESDSYKVTPKLRYNVRDSDGSVIFGNISSQYAKITKQACMHFSRPYLENPTVEDLVNWIVKDGITVLNIVGDKGTKLTNEERVEVHTVLETTLRRLGLK